MTLDLSGLAVALATPFTTSGELDLAAFRRLVRHVVGGGVDTLIPLGTRAKRPPSWMRSGTRSSPPASRRARAAQWWWAPAPTPRARRRP